MVSTFKAVNAQGYQQIMGRFSSQLATSFLDYIGRAPGQTILDLGCGTGSMAFTLAQGGDHKTIVGIDVSEVYVEFARSRTNDSRIQFEVADGSALPFEGNTFDRAVSQLVLQFMPDPFPAVQEMCRVVKPGGLIAACVWDSYGGMSHLRMLYDTASALGFDRDRTLLRPMTTRGELQSMWERAGLEQIEEDSISMRFEYENFEDYWSSFLSGDGTPGSMVMGLTPEQRETLQEQVRHVFLSGKSDGFRSFLASAWICKGVVPETT